MEINPAVDRALRREGVSLFILWCSLLEATARLHVATAPSQHLMAIRSSIPESLGLVAMLIRLLRLPGLRARSVV